MADLSYMIGSIVDAIVSVLTTIVSAIADNAETIALLVVTGLIIGAVVRYGRSMFAGLRGMLPF